MSAETSARTRDVGDVAAVDRSPRVSKGKISARCRVRRIYSEDRTLPSAPDAAEGNAAAPEANVGVGSASGIGTETRTPPKVSSDIAAQLAASEPAATIDHAEHPPGPLPNDPSLEPAAETADSGRNVGVIVGEEQAGQLRVVPESGVPAINDQSAATSPGDGAAQLDPESPEHFLRPRGFKDWLRAFVRRTHQRFLADYPDNPFATRGILFDRDSLVAHLRDAAVKQEKMDQPARSVRGVELVNLLSRVFDANSQWFPDAAQAFVSHRVKLATETNPGHRMIA